MWELGDGQAVCSLNLVFSSLFGCKLILIDGAMYVLLEISHKCILLTNVVVAAAAAVVVVLLVAVVVLVVVAAVMLLQKQLAVDVSLFVFSLS